MIVAWEIRNTQVKNVPIANISITNLKRTRPGSNAGFLGERPVSNPLAAKEKVTLIVLFKY